MKPIKTLDDISNLSTCEINERWVEVKSAMDTKPTNTTIEYDSQKEWAQKGYKPIELLNKKEGN